MRSHNDGEEFNGRSLLVTRTDWRDMNNMLKEPRKRTEKGFEEDNDYHDRGMVKWLTAFAMEELAKSISIGKEAAMKDIPILPQMSPLEIDIYRLN